MIKFLDNIIYLIIIINYLFICEIQCRSLLFLNTESSVQASEEDIRNYGYKQFSSYNNEDMQASLMNDKPQQQPQPQQQNEEPYYGSNEEEFSRRYSLLMNSRNKDNNKESIMDFSEKNNDKYNKLSSLSSSSISNNEYFIRNLDAFKEKSNTPNDFFSKFNLNKLPINNNNDDNHDNNNNNSDSLSTFSSLFSFSSPSSSPTSSSSMPIFKSSETFNENISKSSYESNLKNDNDVKPLLNIHKSSNIEQLNEYAKTKNDVSKPEVKKEFTYSYDESGKSILNDLIKSAGKKGSYINDDDYHKGLWLIDKDKDNKDMTPKNMFHPLMKDPSFRKEFEKEFVENLNNKEINFTSNITNNKTESDQHPSTLIVTAENTLNITKQSSPINNNNNNTESLNDDKLDSKNNNNKSDYIRTWDEEFHFNKKDEKEKKEDDKSKSNNDNDNINEMQVNDFMASESKKRYNVKSVSETNNVSNTDDKREEDKRVEDVKVEDKRIEDRRVEDKKVEDKKVEDRRVEDIYIQKNVSDRNSNTNGMPKKEEEVSWFDRHEVYNNKAPIKTNHKNKGRKHHDDLNIRVNIIFSEIPDLFMQSMLPYNKQTPSSYGPGFYGDAAPNNDNINKKNENNESKFNVLKLIESFEQFKTNTNNITDTKLSSQITEMNTTQDDVFRFA